MKKKFITFLSALGLSACIGAGDNSPVVSRGPDNFPAMKGIDLTGEERPIPQSLEGDLNIITVAFEREQQSNVDTWIPYAEQIIAEHSYIRFYEIPLIYEMNMVMRGWVNNGMRSGIEDEKARERTITVYTDRDDFFEMMDMRRDTIYTLLLDGDGKILWRESGDASEKKIESLKTVINRYKRS